MRSIGIGLILSLVVFFAGCDNPNIGVKKQDLIGYWEAEVISKSGLETFFFMKFKDDNTGVYTLSFDVPSYGGVNAFMDFDYTVEYDQAFIKITNLKEGSHDGFSKLITDINKIMVMNLSGVDKGVLRVEGNQEFDPFTLTRKRY